MPEPPMTDEYIRLSFLAGHFAASWDHYLGINYFAPLIREHGWHLTQELLDGWKAEALKLGVPVKETEIPNIVKRLFKDPHFYAAGRRAQLKSDTRRNARKN